MSDEEIESEAPRITDNRGKKKAVAIEVDQAALIGEMTDEQKQAKRLELQALLESTGTLSPEDSIAMLLLQSEDIDDDAPQPKRVMTAFLILIDYDNSASASGDIDQLLELDRPASYDDITAGCAVVVRDIDAMNVATRLMAAMEGRAQSLGRRG